MYSKKKFLRWRWSRSTHRILMRKRRTLNGVKSKVVFPSKENIFTSATAKTHCLYNPVQTDFGQQQKWKLTKSYFIPYWSFCCLQTTRTFVDAFFLHFCGDWLCDSAVSNHFVEGNLMACHQTPRVHVDISAAYITHWLKQTWIAGTQLLEWIPLCTFILRRGVFKQKSQNKATIFRLLIFCSLFTFG